MNNRRKLVIALGASALAAPFVSLAQQQGKVWRVGFLSARSRPASLDSADVSGAFSQGMRELGYVEGKNLVVEWRFADGKLDRLPQLAAELVQLKVDVIVTAATPPHQRGTEGDHHDPHRFWKRRRSGRRGFGQEPGATRRKYHGAFEPQCGHESQAP